jgi:hypothetical protein
MTNCEICETTLNRLGGCPSCAVGIEARQNDSDELVLEDMTLEEGWIKADSPVELEN